MPATAAVIATYCGLKINKDAKVQNVFGEVIRVSGQLGKWPAEFTERAICQAQLLVKQWLSVELQRKISQNRNKSRGSGRDRVISLPNPFVGGKMRHRVEVTVLDTLLYEDLQHRYCQNPCSGKCPVYNKGDVFIFYREDGKDSFWQCGLNTLVSKQGNPEEIAGGPDKPFCSEAWDAISRYIYTGLQGGPIMKGWMKEENTMIACCSDGTRPVIFKIERIDIP